MNRYTVEWTDKFSTTIEAENANEAKRKARNLIKTPARVWREVTPENRGTSTARRAKEANP